METPKPQKPIEISYKEPSTAPERNETNIEEIIGSFSVVDSVPTWIPRLYKDNIVLYANGATFRLYVYYPTTNTWKYTALT